MAYLIDSSVFIQAKNLHYGFDFCRAFWDWIVREHAAAKVLSIEHVSDELQAGQDELSTWASQLNAGFFVVPDATTLTAAARVSAWVTQQSYEPAAISTFLQVADYWLVATALAGGHTVVTHEVPAASVKKIKIPNVCVGVGVAFMTPYQMLRREQARFVLGPAP
ncbi:DUF4411 family protein [Candidatus Paracaedibacter symbiosus]|uniref:DUF4411 family protein n=1 Tax=Candidatus Paracaedibacter symbiosus TaxID=244582 RepID=UPI000509B834|nr:DUF4411 family protein [Candidatus Paracaedibacter symbiosus]